MPSKSKKKPKIIWLQSITCNGNSHSFLNHPELFFILSNFEMLYHPFLESKYSLKDIFNKSIKCDILILEGAFRKEGLKKFNKEVYEVALSYASSAKHIITAGTCATFGGVFKEYDKDNISGFCFDAQNYLDNFNIYKDRLVSLPGCPIHPKWLSFVLQMIENKKDIALDELNRPLELYSSTIHQGCSRSEYFEWKVDTKGFGYKEGCMFYELGCQAPFTHGSCNKILWSDVSSKTNIGTPCFGCTEPEFPKTNLFSTPTNMGIPKKVPLGISKRAYLTVTGIAKGFKFQRLESRLINYED